MCEFNSQLTPKEEKSSLKFSHQLLQAFNCEKFPLKSIFICIQCNGISINPLFCQFCGYSYCKTCIKSIAQENIYCHCKKSILANFEVQLNHQLNKTFYFIFDQYGNYNNFQQIQITYTEALNKAYNKYPLIFSEHGKISYSSDDKYDLNILKIMEKVKAHKNKFAHERLTFKHAQMINFHCVRKFRLNLRRKILCEKEGNFLQILHLYSIQLESCSWNTEFAINLSKVIQLNRKRIKSFSFIDKDIYNILKNNSNNFKSYLLICNALSFCPNLETLTMIIKLTPIKENLIPKSFYSFLSFNFSLKVLNINHLIFYIHMNFQPFQRLIFLETLQIKDCSFHSNCFESFYVKNFSNLKKLYLIQNTIIESKNKLDIKEIHFNSIIRIRFPEYLILDMKNINTPEGFIFQELIQINTISLKYLSLNFGLDFKMENINRFCQFLKSSKVQFLELSNIIYFKIFEDSDFQDFLKNSEYLHGLKFMNLK